MVRRLAQLLRVAGALMGLTMWRGATDAAENDPATVEHLASENRKLQAQVREQQKVIEALAAEMAAMRGASERHERELADLLERVEARAPAGNAASTSGGPAVRITGEAGLAFFRTGAAGRYPNSEFRVDDAKVAIEAQVWRNTFAFAEFNLLIREANDEAFNLGEFYLDFEDVLPDRLANVRVGRINIPFGEEYQKRSVMNNPLISHSLSDIWGIDEGIELYGEAGKFQYVIAVQNGGHSLLYDYDADKAVTGRLGYDPTSWLHLSASAMRTGDLSAADDSLSEVWFGNGFFRALGGAATTRTFAAELYEIDAIARWRTGHVAAAAGWVSFDDDDTAANQAREMNYHFVEALQEIGRLYGVARYSEIRAPKGYPLVGWGKFRPYFFGPFLTEQLERLSLGFGYRFGPPLVVKFEYTNERGRTTDGASRDQEILSTEVGFRF